MADEIERFGTPPEGDESGSVLIKRPNFGAEWHSPIIQLAPHGHTLDREPHYTEGRSQLYPKGCDLPELVSYYRKDIMAHNDHSGWIKWMSTEVLYKAVSHLERSEVDFWAKSWQKGRIRAMRDELKYREALATKKSR